MRRSMSLSGGLDMYGLWGARYGTDEAPYGRKVYFLNQNGYDPQREQANNYFKEGDILTVNEIYVGRSSSEVEFIEHPGKHFNTVMFADVELPIDPMGRRETKDGDKRRNKDN